MSRFGQASGVICSCAYANWQEGTYPRMALAAKPIAIGLSVGLTQIVITAQLVVPKHNFGKLELVTSYVSMSISLIWFFCVSAETHSRKQVNFHSAHYVMK